MTQRLLLSVLHKSSFLGETSKLLGLAHEAEVCSVRICFSKYTGDRSHNPEPENPARRKCPVVRWLTAAVFS